MKRSIKRVSTFLYDSLYALPIGCAAALVWVNTLPESYYRTAHALAFVVNDIGLAIFLGLVMKEVVEATLPGGALYTWRRAALPLAGAVGGTVVPIAIYMMYLRVQGEVMLAPAWVVTCAVDIAACYIVGRIIFGRHAAFSFLMLLAIGIDAIGLAALAMSQPIHDVHLLLAAGMMAVAIGATIALRRGGVRNFWWYLVGPGVLSWWALFLGGLQPALALMPIVAFMPHAAKDTGLFVEPTPQAHDTLTKFERWWEKPVQGILLLLGLVNAGVPLHGLEEGLWAVPVAVLIGRPIGVMAAAGLAVAAGLHLPRNVRWPDIAVTGCVSSIGMIMALFFAGAAMGTGPLQLELKTGALLTCAGAIVALAAARVLHVGRFASDVGGRPAAPLAPVVPAPARSAEARRRA